MGAVRVPLPGTHSEGKAGALQGGGSGSSALGGRQPARPPRDQRGGLGGQPRRVRHRAAAVRGHRQAAASIWQHQPRGVHHAAGPRTWALALQKGCMHCGAIRCAAVPQRVCDRCVCVHILVTDGSLSGAAIGKGCKGSRWMPLPVGGDSWAWALLHTENKNLSSALTLCSGY